MTNDLCTVLGVDKPILSAPMAGAAGPDVVAAVTNAGGFGVIPLWGRPADAVRDGIAEVRARTDGPFAVNINMGFPFDDALDVCIAEGVAAVSLFWGMEPDAVAKAKDAGLRVLYSVGSAAEAKTAVGAGADVIVAQGWEAGGHVWGQVATMALIPAVADAVDVPVVAAGGIADGRGMAAALMLGASGVWIGTRLLASAEATIHPTYQESILNATEAQTEWYKDLYDVGWPDAPHRALRNATSEGWAEAGACPMGARPGEGEAVGHRPTGEPVLRYQSYTPLAGTTGDVEAMSLWAGQGVGLVRDVKTAGEIVDEIYDAARAQLNDGAGKL